MRQKSYTLIFLVLALSLFACSKRAMIRKFYLLETPGTVTPITVAHQVPFLVDVRDFKVSKAFDQTRIAIRTKSHELNYYYYHHWAVKPSSAIADMIFQLIDNSGLFQRCARGYTFNPDYIITGRINTIERLYIKETESAHLSGVFELVDVKNDSLAIRNEFDKEVLLEDKSMNGFAVAISNIITDQTENFIKKMETYFSERKFH